jgi:altronate dehydratase large subunit
MDFWGFRRADGRAGVRNHVLVLPTVGCASEVCARIAAQVQGAVSFVNPNGCGETDLNLRYTRDVLTGLASNPNVYGVICVGIGCELNTMDSMLERLDGLRKPVEGFTIQEAGGSIGAIARGVRLASLMAGDASEQLREQVPVSELLVGLECGGSDATSGLASNPVLGNASDRLVALGGTVMFSETSEMIGAEDILAARADSPELSERIRRIIRGREDAMRALGEDIRASQPGPGNKAGGITTLEEKTLGCIYKGGTTPVREFADYAVAPAKKGLVLMDTPAYDLCSMTAMAAGGCQLIVFTTGRGSVSGCPVAPVVKVTANPKLAEAMADNLDFSCSAVITAGQPLDEHGEKLLDHIIRTASGRLTKAEIFGFGPLETVIARACDYL